MFRVRVRVRVIVRVRHGLRLRLQPVGQRAILIRERPKKDRNHRSDEPDRMVPVPRPLRHFES